jgi:hypothetical protein
LKIPKGIDKKVAVSYHKQAKEFQIYFRFSSSRTDLPPFEGRKAWGVALFFVWLRQKKEWRKKSSN